MSFTYGASVVLISLAIYGILCFLYDLWAFYCRRKLVKRHAVSLLIFVQDAEQYIEYLMYDLIERLERADFPCDVVLVDCGSDDLTYDIMSRMIDTCPEVTVLRFSDRARPVKEALPLCRGSVIHVIDLVSRVALADFSATVSRLLEAGGQQAAVGRN